jgi:hypothetical protein
VFRGREPASTALETALAARDELPPALALKNA